MSALPDWTPEIEARFWSHIDRSGGPEACWPLNASYRFHDGQKLWVHRATASLLLTGSPTTKKSGWTCGQRSCCNPAHAIVPRAPSVAAAYAQLAADPALRGYMARKLAARVDRSAGAGECWEYLGPRSPDGYGDIGLCGFHGLAHRVAWCLETGADPGELMVCHHCDNPGCCNPAHLFLGTAGDNNRDRDLKGRGGFRAQPGVRNGSAKLTDELVTEIFHGRGRHVDIGERYGVAQTMVSRIKRREAWRHVTAAL